MSDDAFKKWLGVPSRSDRPQGRHLRADELVAAETRMLQNPLGLTAQDAADLRLAWGEREFNRRITIAGTAIARTTKVTR